MPKVFIETSVFIRFLTKDHQAKYQDCLRLFEVISKGKLRPYTSNIVIMEIVYILIRQYKFSKKSVLSVLDKLLQLRNLTLIEETNSKKALKLYGQLNLKYADALIATQVPVDATLASYDEDFKKIKSLVTQTPRELLETE